MGVLAPCEAPDGLRFVKDFGDEIVAAVAAEADLLWSAGEETLLLTGEENGLSSLSAETESFLPVGVTATGVFLGSATAGADRAGVGGTSAGVTAAAVGVPLFLGLSRTLPGLAGDLSLSSSELEDPLDPLDEELLEPAEGFLLSLPTPAGAFSGEETSPPADRVLGASSAGLGL